MRPVIRRSAPEEEAIQRGIAQDPDNPEITDEQWARMRPARKVTPAEPMAEHDRRMRGKQRAATKALVSLQLDRHLLDTLRASGRGWQGRADGSRLAWRRRLGASIRL